MSSLLSKSFQKKIANGEQPVVAKGDQVAAAAATQRRIDEQKQREAASVAALMARIAAGKPAPEQPKTVNPFVGLTDEEVERLQR